LEGHRAAEAMKRRGESGESGDADGRGGRGDGDAQTSAAADDECASGAGGHGGHGDTTPGRGPHDPRGDASLLRHLAARFGAQTAWAWGCIPYVRLPGDGFVEYLVEHADELRASMPSLAHMPWDDVVFDFAAGHADLANVLRARRAAEATRRGRTVVGYALDTVHALAGRCWMRLSTLRRYLEIMAAASPWCFLDPLDAFAHFRAQLDRYVVLEVWDDAQVHQQAALPGLGNHERQRSLRSLQARGAAAGLARLPTTVVFPRGAPWDEDGWATRYLNLQCRGGRAYGPLLCTLAECKYPVGDMHQAACMGQVFLTIHEPQIALLTLAYLARCDEYLVEVTPTSPTSTAQPATDLGAVADGAGSGETGGSERVVPGCPDELGGTAPDGQASARSHFILLDPLRAGEYGAGGAGGPGVSDTHVSPRATMPRTSPIPPRRAHTRRGHWRTLRSEHFVRQGERVWVRQAWIGPREWIHDGQRYRVLMPAVPGATT